MTAPTRRQVLIDVEALVRAMPLIKQPGNPGDGFGLDYFRAKHEALIAFYLQCGQGPVDPAANPLQAWIEAAHTRAVPYRNAPTTEDRAEVCRRAEELYHQIRRRGVEEPLVLEGTVQLPGVLDGGNRLAILRVLRIRHVRCAVDETTARLVRDLRIGTVEGGTA